MASIDSVVQVQSWLVSASLIIASTAVASPVMANERDATSTANENRVPYRLLMPLLQPFSFFNGESQLLVGTEAPALPVHVPLPQPGRIKWTLIHDDRHFTLMFEVPQTRADAEKVYLEQLAAAGWLPRSSFINNDNIEGTIPLVSPESGETNGIPQNEALIFCQQNDNAQLTLHFVPISPETTNLQAELSLEQLRFGCNPQSPRFPDDLPALELPAPANTESNRITGSSHSTYTEYQSIIHSELTLETLAEHYAFTMTAQGWELDTQSRQTDIHWSLWSQVDEAESQQQAMIGIFQDGNNPNQYLGFFRTQLAGALPYFETHPVQEGTLPKDTALQILRDRGQVYNHIPEDLWLGQLPPSPLTDFQVPDETIILGGVSFAESSMALLETTLHPQTARDFYQEQLIDRNWNPDHFFNLSDSLAFQPSGYTFLIPDLFCQWETGHEMLLLTQPSEHRRTLITQSIYPSSSSSPCHGRQESSDAHTSELLKHVPIPILQAPMETTVLPEGSSIHSQDISFNAYIQSELTSEDLVSHYSAQMQEAGWNTLSELQTENSYISLWQIETDRGTVWQRTLRLIAPSATDQWNAHFSAFTQDTLLEDYGKFSR